MSLQLPGAGSNEQKRPQRSGFLLVPTDRLASAFATPPRPIDPADEIEQPTVTNQPAPPVDDENPMFVITAETPMEPIKRPQ